MEYTSVVPIAKEYHLKMLEYVTVAVQLTFNACSWIVSFPFLYILFPIVRFCFGIVNHFLLIPIFLIFRTVVYGLIYIPLKPVLSVANVKYDTLVPVEVTIYRLCTASLPHLHVFLYHFIHFFMVSLLVGSFVGMIVGVNISIVSRIIQIPETKTDAAVKRLNEFTSSPPEWKRVKRELQQAKASPISKAGLKLECTDQNSKPDNLPKVRLEHVPVQAPQMPQLSEFASEAMFEDDDGYNFMTYKLPDERKKQAQREQVAKRRESRHKSVTQSLHTTIEEESESEITPTSAHATGAVTPTNHVSLDYATGTIGSLKTFSAESSVFSKTNISGPRTDMKEEEEQPFRKSPSRRVSKEEDKESDGERSKGTSSAEKPQVSDNAAESQEYVPDHNRENEESSATDPEFMKLDIT